MSNIFHHTHINLCSNISTVFEYLAACLSVIFELLPGLIPFASLWHAGCIFEKHVYMHINYSYLTTIYKSIFAQMYIFLVEKYYLQFLLKHVYGR